MLVAAAVGAPSVIATQGETTWVATWAAMPQLTEPQNLPPAPFTQFADTTLRQTVHTSIGGETLRLRFSNAFGGAPLPITKAAVALPAGGQAGVSAIEPGSSRPVTFAGRRSTVIPVGALMVSDPVDMDVPAQGNVTVTIYLRDGQASESITSHPGSRTTRFDRDVIAQSGVDSVIVFEGVNDIGTADATPEAQQAVGDALIAAYQQFVIRAHAQGIRVYGATITPFRGFELYMNPAGYRALAAAVPTRLFR